MALLLNENTNTLIPRSGLCMERHVEEVLRFLFGGGKGEEEEEEEEKEEKKKKEEKEKKKKVNGKERGMETDEKVRMMMMVNEGEEMVNENEGGGKIEEEKEREMDERKNEEGGVKEKIIIKEEEKEIWEDELNIEKSLFEKCKRKRLREMNDYCEEIDNGRKRELLEINEIEIKKKEEEKSGGGGGEIVNRPEIDVDLDKEMGNDENKENKEILNTNKKMTEQEQKYIMKFWNGSFLSVSLFPDPNIFD
jgi:hypothetical protein